MPVVRPAIFAAMLLLSCWRNSSPRIAIERITVAPGPALDRLQKAGLSPDDVRGAAEAALSGAPGIAAVAPHRARGARLYDARVEIVFTRATVDPARVEAGGAATAVPDRVVVALDLELSRRGGEGHVREGASWTEPGRAGEGTAVALRRAIGGAIRKAASDIVVGLAEEAKEDSQLIRDLGAADARVRDYAVRILADRRNPAAVPPLIERLHDPDGTVAERAMGALAQIRDPRAVGPLIDLGQRREGAALAELVRVIGDVGGPEAEAYLVTVASGYPDPAVRDAAREALADLRARKRERPPVAVGR